MFKIESYVTPLILSYVDKYIKNIKPEDSQVSLWGGDAVFHNLDLRLDVLEAELHSPFTFSSGHIHELRIHVPWTKLASESIVITINTIECTLKLKSTEDRLSEKSSLSQKARSKRQEVPLSPPGYIQSLMSKIVNNISIVCNNVILKYLEEDIVLSLNARTVALTSADANWETAFTELAAPDFILRKTISVSDLTICLDQCNAQGKIPTYQEPFLYRCSLTVRISSVYPNSIGAKASKTRIDLLFPKLDFSLSDQQIPMFIRLFNLALALYLGDFKNRSGKKEEAVDSASTVVDDNRDEEQNDESQSWLGLAGWAWGYVPAILPVWDSEATDGTEVFLSDRDRVIELGVFIERVNWTFKWAEMIRDVSISSAPSRLRFQPFLTARMQGCFLSVTLGGVEWVDVQGGISHLTLEPSSPCCLCGAPEETSLYYLQGCERTTFLSQSLYDSNQIKSESSNYEWDSHIQRVTEATMLERTPALGFDYLYQLELPEENASEFMSQLGSELEYSNLPEKALFRLAVSPLQLKISFGLCHRLSALLHAAHQYNYPDYSSAGLGLQHRPLPEPEHISTMAANLPSKTYQVAVLRPLVFISVSPPHPAFDLQRLVERRVIRMKDTLLSGPALADLPVLKLACTCADLQVIRPMYPIRLTLALQSLPTPPPILAQQGHTRIQLKFQDLSAELVTEERHIPLLKPCNASARLQLLLLPELWQVERVLSHWKFESEALELLASRPQLDYVLSVWKALTDPVTSTTLSRLLATQVLNLESHPALQLNIHGFRLDYIQTPSIICAGSIIKSLNASIVQQSNSVPFFSHTLDPHRSNFVDWLIQAPYSLVQRKPEAEDAAPVLVFKMASFDVLLDSGWLKWLSYRPETSGENIVPAQPEEETKTIQPTSTRSNQSNCARDSGLSSSMDGQTWRASSLQQLTHTKSSGQIKSDESVDWIGLRRQLQRSILHIDIQPSSLVIPAEAEELRLQFQLPAVYVSCPHIRTSSLTVEDLPFREGGSSVSSFPWTVSFQHFGLSSGCQDIKLRPILEPVSLKMTIALNPSTTTYPADGKSTESRPPSIDLCIHVDMNAVEVALDVEQLKLLCDKSADLSAWLGASVDSPSTSSNRPDFDVGLWLQWAMPRFVLSLETPSSRTVLDMEDVTTSVDYQHRQYAKIKSRLTSVSVKLFIRNEETWILEPKTNGIVMSCSDDITRDLWPSTGGVGKTVAVPSIAETPADVFQSQPAGKNSVGASTGGILTLTWTRAQRQDVHSKWHSRSRRKSSQTEDEVEEVVNQSDRYLQELDVALEAIDLVVTEILLIHVIQLAQPIFDSLTRIFPSTSSLPASSHTLPLIFATSKGLRIFLVQDRFLLLNLDGAELSPHVQNPIGRSVQLKPDLYYEAERQGLVFVPGHDVEDRQYQIDLSGLSFSSGYWKEVGQASWVWRTLNPASTLHTMAENPALEWNARQEQPSEPRVGLTPILARCSFRAIYAPPIVSLEQQCVVAGQAVEVNASSDIQLLIDIHQIDYYLQWIDILQSAFSGVSSSQEQEDSGYPSHSFFTSNRIGLIIYKSEPEEYLPYAWISLIEPHALIKTGEQEIREMAIHDIRLQLPCWASGSPVRSGSLPDESMFPISLVETRAGQPSAITGVPPSLFRLELVSALQLAVELGRPLKLILHADNIANLQFLASQLDTFQSNSTEESRPSSYRQIVLKSSQIIVEIPVPSAIITAGLNDMVLDMTCQFDSKEEKREKLDANFSLNAFSIKAEVDQDTNLQLCDPFSLDCRVQLLWPHWLSNGRVLLHAFCRADNLRLHAGPRQVLVVQTLTQWMLDNYTPSTNEDPAAKAVDKDEQHYQDDLRTGAFDFQVRDTTNRPVSSGWMQTEERPRPYQVVFNVQPASMCWAYPQPRALTRVDVYPIPLIKADGASPDSSGGVEQVDCTLEYWDHSSQQFCVLRRFSLSEVRFTRVSLPSLSNPSGRTVQEEEKRAERELLENRVAFSDMWRIVMHFTEESLPENRPKKIIAAPPSLVACTRIDSYFNASMVPDIQLGCTFNHISLALHSQMANPSGWLDGQYQLDGTMPTDFPFAALNFNSVSANFKCRLIESLTASLDLSAQVQANLINFQYLVDESILEPTALDVKMSLDEGKSVTALVSSHRSLDFNLSQCSIHTLSSCLTSWNAHFNGESCNPLYTHYVVRNDTQDVLRIGQSGTGESILLTSRQAHQYAWKVMGEHNQLQACTEGGRWRWCQPCSVDRPGTHVRLVVESRPKLPLIWAVKTLNSLQKEVTIRGQVQVANLLPETLEVKLVPSKTEPTSSPVVVGEMKGQVSPNSVAPSFVFPLEHLQAVKVRLPGNTWSGLIPLVQPESKTRNVLLVRVAQKDKENPLNLWCHLWVEKVDQHYSRLLVLFSPLYVVRSYLPQPLRLHLRTPGLNSSQHSEIIGCGHQSVLECPGSVDHGHQLSFQLSSSLPESTPPVPLSWTMASQYTGTPNQNSVFIDDLLEQLFPSTDRQVEKYPFVEDWDFIDSTEIPQPKTDVRVTFSGLNQRCHSLLVELKPWALLVNHSGIDLVLKRINDSEAGCWSLPNRAVMAPPPMNDDTFQIGWTEDGQLDRAVYSQPLLLQDQDHFHFMYRPKVEGAIPLEGHCCIRITNEQGVVCFLTVTSKMHEGIRILCIQPTFRIHNDTSSLLKVGCSFSDGQQSWKQCVLKPGNESRAVPLLFWQGGGKSNPDQLLLSLRLCSDWSCPIQLYHPGSRNSSASSVNPQRYSVSVPLSSGCNESEIADNCPVILIRLEQSGLVYLSVAVDPNPLWVLINRTEHSMAYAQASDSVPGQAESDCPQFSWHGVVRSNGAAFYTPPWGQQRYLDASPPVNLPRLVLSLDETKPEWSHPVHPSHTYDQFLSLTPTFDVMIRIVRTATPNQKAIYIEPVSRVEVSASDIRGRIEIPPSLPPPALQEVVVRPTRPTRRSPCKADQTCRNLHQIAGDQLAGIVDVVPDEKEWNVTVYWPEIGFCLRDDTTVHRREMARLTADHVLIDYFQNPAARRMTLRCGHVQMDNQMYRPEAGSRPENDENHGYDFPVVFLAQNSITWSNKSLLKLLDKIRQCAFVVLELGLTSSGRPTALDFQLDPIFLFIEDRFIVAVIDYMNSFSFNTTFYQKKRPDESSELVSFPGRIAETLSSLSVFVNLDQLKIRAISLDLSLRSSVKLYIALDHSPLRLDAFERPLVLTTPYRLGQTLAMHYVSSALFKAGWVVGSMELLGSPTALARTVTLGLKDFVRLPYQGIWRGPRGFLAGILNGSASLVSHVTAGTVTSVTQLASSVARNVDRLSFDSDFQQRSEEGRRKKPQGLVQGIGWGLSALGLSLLGALGGLAHHPLQSLIEDGTVSPRGLAVGLTKGIVGVVAKPISGAADLVAQTGQGLLSATQWSEPFQARRPQSFSSNHQLELICSGPAKILWKLSDETPPLSGHHHAKASRICCCLEAMRARVNDALPIREQLAPVILLVSTQNFCVLNAEDGEVQVVLDLNEVDCWAHKTDPTLILVRPTPLSAPALVEPRREDEFNPHYDYQRVSEFVKQTTPFFLPDVSVETLQEGTHQTSSIATMEFFLNPTTKDFFIQCFQMAKQQRKGVGFALL